MTDANSLRGIIISPELWRFAGVLVIGAGIWFGESLLTELVALSVGVLLVVVVATTVEDTNRVSDMTSDASPELPEWLVERHEPGEDWRHDLAMILIGLSFHAVLMGLALYALMDSGVVG